MIEFSRKKKILFACITLALLLVFIEAGLHIFDYLRGGPHDIRYDFDAFKGKDWPPQFFKDSNDFAARGGGYAHYVEWSAKDFHSTYFNFAADGARQTWNPSSTKPLPELLMLGGSAMLGAGARDDHTIPSELSRLINEKNPTYLVKNQGQAGYIFTQEVIKLFTLLRAGERPQAVVFYNGTNNIVAAYDGGQAGSLSAEGILRTRLEASPLGTIWFAVKEIIRDDCESCRAVINIGRYFSQSAFRIYDIKGFQADDSKLVQLGKDTGDEYVQSLEAVDALSRAYNFKYFVFWQPTLFMDKKIIGDEAKLTNVDWRLNIPGIFTLYQSAQDEIFQSTSTLVAAHVANFSRALEDRTTSYFLDSVHITEDGDVVVAQKMIDTLKAHHIISQ